MKSVSKISNDIEKMGFVKKLNHHYLKHINESKFVIGLAMILLNIGSKNNYCVMVLREKF